METLLIVAIISVCSGAGTALLVRAALGYAGSVQAEERFRSAVSPAKDRLRGLPGYALFYSKKIGTRLRNGGNPRVLRHIAKIEGYLAMFGRWGRVPDADTFVGMQILAAAGAALAAAIALSVYNPVLLAAFGAGGFYAPYGMLKERVQARRALIQRQLPDVLDLLAMMVCAGLDFSTALNRVTAAGRGALVDELLAVQQQTRLGKSRAAALGDMSAKVGLPALTGVVNALTLALATGSGMARSLQTLADQFRVEQAQRVEKKAAEAPLKLMMPLILLVFPTIFIILFGPILLSFMGKGL